MKKTLILLLLMLTCTVNCLANYWIPSTGRLIEFRVYWHDPTPGNNPCPRTPVQRPRVYIDDHTLYFAQEFDVNLLLKLENEDREVVLWAPNLKFVINNLVR